ncbi:MAG TPA: recombinase family protein [Nitrospiraceae bacterium]|nr:recombinase family protein [Nitrospiraceae bacterium]
MRVAFYARYSSEGQREASIDDQFRNCERYAKREGWPIVERYADKALSGTKDEKGRDGYAAMLKAARAKQFDVLLVDDLSRLSRDSMKTEEARRLFVYLGVRLIGISDGIDTAAKGHKALSGFKGLMNDIFLDDLRDKTHRGLAGQALKGNNCGGRNYGYRHVPVEHPTEKDEYGRPKILAVRRVIDPEQARWVRQIYEWYAGGKSPRQIAEELNQLKVPSPGASYRRRRPCARYGTWAASVLHGELNRATGILTNPIYVGKAIWNRREWVLNPETKRKLPKLRPESEWIETDQPHLRIIPQALWLKVQARRKAAAIGPQRQVRSPKYLLSGLLKCAECQSNFVVQSYYQYGCAGHKDRGGSVCGNGLKVSRTLAEQKLLAGIQRDLFSPERLDLFVKETSKLLAERSRQRQPERDRAHLRLNEVEGEIANIMMAIKAGILTASTKMELQKAELERDRLYQTVTTSTAQADKVVTLLPRARERYRDVIEGIGALSAKHLPQAREQVRALVGYIWLKPTKEGHLEATLTGRYAGLLKLLSGGKLNHEGCGGRI